MDPEVSCIQEAIGQFYSFFGRMVQLKNDIEHLDDLDLSVRDRILTQLEDIEREYKYSQEWFMTRDVQDVRVGVVGSDRSLKTAVVSLFVEGVLEIEGDEKDGRSKSKINVDGKCKLLLIREETGAPSKQLSQWADVLLFVFSYADEESLLQINDYYRIFRETNQESPVMLVGVKDDQYSLRQAVREGDVRKTAEHLDKCQDLDVGLSQQSTYTLFAQACRLALSTTANSYPPSFINSSIEQCPNPSFSSSPSQSSISSGVVAAGVQRFGGVAPSSPSHKPRGNKRRSMFGGNRQVTYGVSKLTIPTESFGSGRPVPIKEGFINKKSTGSFRGEWKRKYLELSRDELTYYPSLNDYMAKTHGKSLKLQQITVKVPGQRVSSVSRVTNTPPESLASDFTDSLTVSSQMGNQSDHSNSTSPPPGQLESSLDVSYSSNVSSNVRFGLPIHVTGPSPHNSFDYDLHNKSHDPHQLSHEFRSPVSTDQDEFSSTEHFDEIGSYSRPNYRYDNHISNGRSSNRNGGLDDNGRGHNRNGSLDDNVIMLQQLRTGGISYPPMEDITERSATMPRIEGKRVRDKNKPGSLLSALPGSEELLSGGTQGSQDSLGRPDKHDRKRKGDKDRNSFVGIERTHSESAKEKAAGEKKGVKGHKRQRSWGGNKLLEVESGGDMAMESCEFQVFSADNKVWCFEASSTEEANAWVKAIEDQIKKTISESVSHKRVNSCNEIEKKEILNIEGNSFCADCNSPSPEWASLNHGCLLCIECSGVHRNLGTHISRIRSLGLDEWSPELISVMMQIGNKMSRSLWEAGKLKTRPLYSTPREEREKFIKAKYIDKEYLADLPYSGKPIYEQLMDAVKTNNVANCLNILAHATTDDINRLHSPPESWAALHVACMLGRTVITQLLIWNGGDINILDADRRSPLFFARSCGHQVIVNILIANSCADSISDTSSVDVTQTHVM